MPKIAMSSSAMVLAPWINALQVAAEIGYDAFEIDFVFPSADVDTVSPADIDLAKQIAKSVGLELCVHAPFIEMNIAAFCKGIRDESIRYVKRSIDFCAAIGAETLVVHSGDYTYQLPTGSSRHNNEGMRRQWFLNIDALKQITDYADEHGIIVCLENLGFKSVDQTIADLLEIREAIGKSLKFTLDIGHARLNVPGGVKEAIRLFGDNVRHIHFTDNNGKYDDHLPIGDGNFDYSGFVDYINAFPHIVTLEVVSIGVDPGPARKSLEYFKTIWK
ncbi:sugar phosphate isomerase/epimerase [candidate division KSB1 bacterium]|nr:sugar phosphate isomerase/epimerase [candidate division KSB1 bacterium]